MRRRLRILLLLCALTLVAVGCGDRFAGIEVTNRCTSAITATDGGGDRVIAPGYSTEILVNSPDEKGVEVDFEITSEASPDWRRSFVLTNGSGLIVSGSDCPE